MTVSYSTPSIAATTALTSLATTPTPIPFLKALARTKERDPFRLLGYCLMTNHFHLLLRPEVGQSTSRILQSLSVAHTWRYHKRYHTLGHVWQVRFKSPVIPDDAHLLVVLRYIDANPLRAKMVTDPAEHRWSSFLDHSSGQDDTLLRPFPEWEELGKTDAERRRRWRAEVCAVQSEAALMTVRSSLRSGRPFGASEWTEQMAARLNFELDPRPQGRPLRVK
jgi:putative transposase